MRDALSFFQSGLTVAQVAEHQQTGQGVFQPLADRLEKSLFLRRPDSRGRALVQPEQVGFIYLGVDRFCQQGLYAETLLQLRRHRMVRSRAESYRTAGSPRGLKYSGNILVH